MCVQETPRQHTAVKGETSHYNDKAIRDAMEVNSLLHQQPTGLFFSSDPFYVVTDVQE